MPKLHSSYRCGDHRAPYPPKVRLTDRDPVHGPILTHHASGGMMYSVTEAARAVGRSKATIIRAIASGMLSATRDDPGKPWRIDPAELARAFPDPVPDPVNEPDHDPSGTPGIGGKNALIAAHEPRIADRRPRLDQPTPNRRHA